MQKYANLVELEKCCQTHIFLQNFVLIQPRTSPPKICKNLLIFPILLTLTPNPNRSTGRPGGARAPLPRRGAALAPRAHDRGPRAQAALEGANVIVRERRLAKFRQNVARVRLYRLRFLQENMRFAAFFKIYQILKLIIFGI